MKRIFFVLICAAMLFSACGGDNPVKVNDTIVKGVDTTVETMGKVMDYVQNDDYTHAKAYLDTVSVQVPKLVEIISKLQNKSAEAFKQASLDYLKLIQKEGVDAFAKAIEWYQAGQAGEDNAKMEEANNLLKNFMDKAEKQEDIVHKAQKEFAEKNNITLY